MNKLPRHDGKLSVWAVLVLSVVAWLGLCYWAVLHKNTLLPESLSVSTANNNERFGDDETVKIDLPETEVPDEAVSDTEVFDTAGARAQSVPGESVDDASVAKLVLVPADVGDELIVGSEQRVFSNVTIGAGPVTDQLQKRIWKKNWRFGEDLIVATAGVKYADNLVTRPLIAVVPVKVAPAIVVPTAVTLIAGSPAAGSPQNPIERSPVSILTAIASRVRFPPGGARPDEITTEALDRLYEHLFIYSDESVNVVVSSHEYDNAIEDRNLSRKRGGEIVRYLVDRGLPEARFMIGIESGVQLPSAAQRVKVTLGARN